MRNRNAVSALEETETQNKSSAVRPSYPAHKIKDFGGKIWALAVHSGADEEKMVGFRCDCRGMYSGRLAA